MQVRELHQDGIHIVMIEGEVDLACSPELRDILHAHAESRREALLLDFAAVSYVDSSGLATLVEYVKLAQDFGGRFALAAVTQRVRTILDLVRLSEVFPIYATMEEAKAAMASSPPGA